MSEYKLDNTDISKKDVDELQKGLNAKVNNNNDKDDGEEKKTKRSSSSRKKTTNDDDDDNDNANEVDEVAAGGKGETAQMLKNLRTEVTATDKKRQQFLDDIASAISGYFRTGLSADQRNTLKDIIDKSLLKKLLSLKKLD